MLVMMFSEEIEENRCSVSNANTFSLAIKFVPDLYCIDFDRFEEEPINDVLTYEELLEESQLAYLLDKADCYRTKTTKGYHFYCYIKDFPVYQNEKGVATDERFEIDMFGSKTVRFRGNKC